MRRFQKSILGVTLLEIMLVLAIAAMIIVMSIRYYQSASQNQKINAVIDDITGIVAAGESFLNAMGTVQSWSTGKTVTYMGGQPYSPWGGSITVSGTAANTYTITVPGVPTTGTVCTQVMALLTSQNTKFVTTCGTSAGLVVTVTE